MAGYLGKGWWIWWDLQVKVGVDGGIFWQWLVQIVGSLGKGQYRWWDIQVKVGVDGGIFR